MPKAIAPLEPPAIALSQASPDWPTIEKVCGMIAKGSSLQSAVDSINGLSSQMWGHWVNADSKAAGLYARAREKRADYIFEECKTIADNVTKGEKRVTKTTGDKVTVEVTEVDMLEHRRLQVETRKWFLAKLDPTRFGDQVRIEHSGAVTLTAAMVRERLAQDPDVAAVLQGRRAIEVESKA